MKKSILICISMYLMTLSLSAQEADINKDVMYVSGTSYYVPGASSGELLGGVTFGYKFFKGWGVSASGYMSDMCRTDKTYGGSVDFYMDSGRYDKVYLIPSVGVGVLSLDNAVKVTGNMAVRLHYNVTRTLFAELEAKAMMSKGLNLFLIGVAVGVNF